MTIQTETVSLADLRPHPDNPRNGDLDAIKESLQAHGQYQPIVVSADNVVLIGNHRYAAMLELGYTDAAIIRRNEQHDDPNAIRLMLIDNRTSDKAITDQGQLFALLEALDKQDSIYGSGFDADDMDALRQLAAAPDLENLGRNIGPPTDTDNWLNVTFRLPPDLAEKFNTYCANNGGAKAAIGLLLEHVEL